MPALIAARRLLTLGTGGVPVMLTWTDEAGVEQPLTWTDEAGIEQPLVWSI